MRIEELHLDRAKEVSTPSDRSATDPKNSNNLQEPKILGVGEAKRYRGVVARLNYLGQDRTEIQYAVKELSKEMVVPTEESMIKAKRLIRYLNL